LPERRRLTRPPLPGPITLELIRREIAHADHCQTDDDCVTIGGSSFGCAGLPINVAYEEWGQELIRRYFREGGAKSRNRYRCKETRGVRCGEGHCQVIVVEPDLRDPVWDGG
jgi:hypothetical protein